ncbi:RMD1 family protein [Patescibacteria group bacterium]
MHTYELTAHYVRNALNLAKIERKNRGTSLLRRERSLLLFGLSESKFVGVFSFGVVAVLGAESDDETERLVRDFGGDGGDEPVEPEEYQVIVDADAPETVDFESIRLKDLDEEKVMLSFWAAAQSVVIDYHETRVDASLSAFEPVHRSLAERGKLVMTSRQAMRTIGLGGSTVNTIIGKLSLLDKPDITWEEEDAERLHAALRKQFELDDRFSILRDKIDFLQESSRIVLDVLDARKSAWLELTIIALIAMEFIFFIFTEIV